MLASFFGWPEKWPKSNTGSKHLVKKPVDNFLFFVFWEHVVTGLPTAYTCNGMYETVPSKAHFTLEVKANVQLKSSIFIDAKVEISPKGFTLGVKDEIEKR